MADQNITALPVATSPTSSDQLLLVGATEEKLIDYDKLADAILTKLTSKQYTLDQGTKTLPAALNELNSNRFSIYEKQVSDLDNPPAAFILNTDINPKGLPELDGNGCCVIQHNPGSKTYTAQLAFSFGCEKIAIRMKKTDSWSAWKYFSAQ